ncbi:MAG: GTPBP1 family GTP-binding protein [Halobacteria archaeon]
MSAAELEEIVEGGERENIEFKERLETDTHLEKPRLESLSAQMRHRIISGDGVALYVVGVTDNGGIRGVDEEAFSETLDVLSVVAGEADANVSEVESYEVEGGKVGVATVTNQYEEKDHLVVGTAGHVDHGKSTLVGTLVTGRRDDGDGGTRAYLDVQPHEIDRGLSADLSFGVYGFENGEPVRLNNPLSKREKSTVVKESDRLVSFVDTVGHEPWLHTTIRGILGQKLDYGLVTVAADDGPTEVTREHLGILLATELPTMVAITKTDLVTEERVEEVEGEVKDLLKNVGKIPRTVTREDVDNAVERLPNGIIVPVFQTSAVTREGFDIMDSLFRRLPETHGNSDVPREDGGDFELYVDRTYQVAGVGTVVSGTVRQGVVEEGDTVYLGPLNDGKFRKSEVRSIEMHYHRVDKAKPGNIVGIALKNIKDIDVERGMALTVEPGRDVREFTAEIMVLNHPTRIREGYEPVVHLETVSEATIFQPQDGPVLPGERATVDVRFKFSPYMVEEGQRFVFREGESKGVGTVKKIK